MEIIMKIYEIVKEVGLGLYESPIRYYSTGLIYANKNEAEIKAASLWEENTTEEERKADAAPGHWCDLHFKVRERDLL